MSRKQIIEIVGMFFSAVLSAILTNIFLPMSIAILVGVILFLVILLLFVVGYYKKKCEDIKKEKNILEYNVKELEEKNKKLIMHNKELQNLSIESTRGNRFFLMAISQDLSNPLFTGILEKAVFEDNNVLAGYLLGNIYYSGLEHNGKIILKCDYDKAAKVYQTINENDKYGVSDWMLGWLYQFNLINDAHANADDENMNIARRYYESSKGKGYPKAFNSLANLMINKRAGFDASNEIDAISLYHEAAKLEDNYALLNCGHYYKNQKNNYDVALKYYLQSAKLNCPEGCVNVGEIYEIISSTDNDISNKKKNITEACRNYISCIKLGESFSPNNQKNKFVAKAYYKLGNIINSIEVLDDRGIHSFFEKMNTRDISPHCLSNAYSILSSIIDSLPTDGNEEFFEIYKNLRNMYCNPGG